MRADSPTALQDDPALAAVSETASGRLLALDVFRGLSVAGMILVTNPGTYSAVYPQLLHAEWRGATATDMIFPAFLLGVGAAIPIVVQRRLHRGSRRGQIVWGVVRRMLLLIAIGLMLNAYPDLQWRTLRLPGVLQRIGVCYGVAATLYLAMARLAARQRTMLMGAAAAALLLGYWAILRTVPVPGYGAWHLDTLRNLPAYVDRAVFTVPHLWPYGLTPGVGVTFDPEGLLSTLPAIASVTIGMMVGELLELTGRRRLERRLPPVAAAAVLLFALGLLLDPVVPIIKKIWTPSFALLSSGVAMGVFALLYWLIDVRGWRRGLAPFAVFGTNAIAAFAISWILMSTLNVLQAGAMNWHAWGYSHLFLPWLPPRFASLLYGISIVAINCAVLLPLYRRRIFLRV